MARKKQKKPPEWPPNGEWLVAKDSGQRRCGERSEKSAPSRGRPRFEHPIVTLVQRSLTSKSYQLGPQSRDRFSPFRKQFAMLYLARISPNVTLRVLKDIWPSGNSTKRPAGHSLGKVSSRTIQNAYLRVENEIRSGGLMSKLPHSWILELKKHNLGPWNETVPDWLAEAYCRDCNHIKLPHQARVTKPNEQSVVDGSLADRLESSGWQSEMRAQFDDITREIQELKVAAPGLELIADKIQIVWNACFSEIRKLKGELRGEELVELVAIAEPTIDVSPTAEHAFAWDQFSDECEDSVISECIDANPIQEDREEVSMLIPVWKRLRITNETTTTHEETPITDSSSNTQNRKERRTELLGISRNELGDDYLNQTFIFNPSSPNRMVRPPDLTFPRLNLTDPERTMEEWMYFSSGVGWKITSKRGVSGWIPKSHDGIARIARNGFRLGVFYGSPGRRFTDSLTLCWLVERVIARVLNLKIDQVIEGRLVYEPKVAPHGDIDTLKWEAHGYRRSGYPITPLLIESLYPANQFGGPKDHQWIHGWGFLPETELHNIKEFCDWIRCNPNNSCGKSTAYQQWAMSIHFASECHDIERCRDKIKELGPDYKGYLPMPMCTNSRRIKIPEVEWLDLSKIKGLWVSEGKGDSAIVNALKGFTTAIHMPTVRMIDSYFLQASSQFYNENKFTDWTPILRM